MAISITGNSAITTLGVAHVYTMSGVEIDTNKPIIWFGHNTFDMRVGEYEKTYWDDTDQTKGYWFKPKQPLDQKKVTIIVDEDLHHQADKFIIFCNVWNKTTKKYEEIKFEGQVGISVPQAKPDYTFSAGVPYDPNNNSQITYVVHERDKPPVTTITTPFRTTYPHEGREYIHKIVYTGDSSFYWDYGQQTVNDNLTPTNGTISANLSVHDWAPHADYTGYITVSAIGSVYTPPHDDGTPAETVAQDGYLIFIEYHTGTAVSVRVLKANENEVLIDANGKGILVGHEE